MKCLLCKEELSEEMMISELLFGKKKHWVCEMCLEQFEKIEGEICLGCSKKSQENYCQDCLEWKKIYPKYDFSHKALFHYNEAMQNYIERYKFFGDYRLRFIFQKEILQNLKVYKGKILIPIPLSNNRMEERRFNQVEGLLDAAGVNYFPCLEKKIDEEKQSSKNRKQRISTNNPFLLKENAKRVIENQEIVLVDDIYTTGRTLFHAYESLLSANPKSVESFSLVRA
ncbi:competence protein ComFC [Pilibacter termitis]|uniref:Competence protein ComFC n=1 Tax=Pilibacter termitis TaxID=263852 RepID=A0A1T4MT07_9ENTE|nr:ComF family protein [Pilibacter termitis]SJZ70132.1 competence protein ComFC [Pilibacter termitis]